MIRAIIVSLILVSANVYAVGVKDWNALLAEDDVSAASYPAPVLWWNFSQPNGATNVIDATSNGNDGKIATSAGGFCTNNVWYASNPFGAYIVLSCTNKTLLNTDSTFALSYWVNKYAAYRAPNFSQFPSFPYTGFIEASGQLRTYINHIYANRFVTPPSTNWTLVTISYSNGVETVQSNATVLTPVVTSNVTVIATNGWSIWQTDNYTSYNVDDVRVWNVPLSSNDMVNLYNAGRSQ